MEKKLRSLAISSVAFFFLTTSVDAQSLSSYARTDKPDAVIEIRAGQQSSFKIPKTSNGDLALFVVNRDMKNAIPATLRLQDFSVAAEANVDTLAADSILTENSGDHPDAIRPVGSSLTVSGNEIPYTFPKLSVTVITFKRK